jgi:hypothetical protein
VKPLVIPTIAWSSAPPPIAPRSFETPAPPPPSPVVATEAPPAMAFDDLDRTTSPPGPVGSDWDDETRVQPDDIRRALGVHEDVRDVAHAGPREPVRDERAERALREERAARERDEGDTRVLVQQMLVEALAPLHFAIRDLERRLVALEQAPPPVAAPRPAFPSAGGIAGAPSLERTPMPGAGVAPVSGKMNLDVFGAVVAAPRVLAEPPPRAPSFDIVIPFDGARRRRRIGILFAVFIVLVFGALFGALISSRVSPG